MEEPKYYIRQANGSVQGPFDKARIRKWAAEGRVRESMLFSSDRQSWVSGADVPGLFAGKRPPPLPTAPDESQAALAKIPPPSLAWFRSFAESKQEVIALRQQMTHDIEEAKRQKGWWRMWSVLGAYGASVAMSSQYRKSTRTMAAAGTVFAMSKAYGRYNDSERALLSAVQNFGTAIDSLDDIFLGSGPSILAPLAWPDEDDDFLGLYVRSLDEVEVFHPVLPRKNRKEIREILLLRASVTPTKRYENHLLRSTWSLGHTPLTEIASLLDRSGGVEATESSRVQRSLRLPYTVYSGVVFFIAALVVLNSVSASGIPSSSLGFLAVVVLGLGTWGTLRFGHALAWQAALRPAVRRAHRVDARGRLARWYGVLSLDPRAARFSPPHSPRSGNRGPRQPAVQWAVPLPRSAGPIWVVVLVLLFLVSGISARGKRSREAADTAPPMSAAGAGESGARSDAMAEQPSTSEAVNVAAPAPARDARRERERLDQEEARQKAHELDARRRREAAESERREREVAVAREKREAEAAQREREAEDERRREEQEEAQRKAEMARFSAAVPGVYRAAHVPGSYLGLGDETDLRYELVLGADGTAGAALFVRGRVKWKASGTWELIGAIRHSGRGLRISFQASDSSVRLPTRIEAGARWSDAQDAPLFGRNAGQDRPAGVYRIQGPFFGQDLQPVELVRTADAPSSVAMANPEALADERLKQAAGKYVPTAATAKTLRAKYRGRVAYRLSLKKSGKFSLYYDIPRAKAVRMSGTWNWDGTTLTLRATKGNARTLRSPKIDTFSFDGTAIDMNGIILEKD